MRGDEFDSLVLGIPLVWHGTDRLKFTLAPDVESRESHSEFLVRTGGMYGFEIGKFTVAPAFNVDVVAGEQALVYGLNFGRGF